MGNHSIIYDPISFIESISYYLIFVNIVDSLSESINY